MRKILLIVLIVIVTVPGTAYAYVDPGIISMLYQILYIFIFGAISLLIFRPWGYLKSLFKKHKSDKRSDSEQNL